MRVDLPAKLLDVIEMMRGKSDRLDLCNRVEGVVPDQVHVEGSDLGVTPETKSLP